MNVKAGFNLIKESFQEWQKDGALDLAAALSYYTIFSLAPLLLVALAVAGLLWDRGQIQGQLIAQVQDLMDPLGPQAVQPSLANAGRHGSGVVPTVLAVVTILFGATGVFVQLQSALNKVWNVEARPGLGIWSFVKTRLISFGMVLGIGFLLLVSLVISTAVSALGKWATGLLPGSETLMQVVTFVVSFAFIILLFALMFKFLPDVEIAWRDVWIGAVVTALLFTLVKFLIGLYLGKSSVASTYGAAGSLVLVLCCFSFFSLILLIVANILHL